MKRVYIFLGCLLALTGVAALISQYPNTTSLQSTDLFIIERPGVSNYNLSAAQMPGELGVQPTNSNLTDWGNWGTNAYANVVSNRTVSGLGSAAFTASSAYDPANTAATVSAILSNHLNAANITQGTVPPANLGSGASISGKFLRGDSTWQTIGGGGDMLGANNLSDVANTGTALANIGGISNNYTGILTLNGLHVTVGMTNDSLTASTLVQSDSHKKLISIANGLGALTNDATGNFGYAPLLDASTLGANSHVKTGATTNLISSEDGGGLTNTIPHTHEGTATNITATFNGSLQSFTITNGPDIFFGYAGANGSVSYRITTNSTLHFTYQPKWLAGSNSVITNGVLSLTSYGGTNATQLEAAMKENQ